MTRLFTVDYLDNRNARYNVLDVFHVDGEQSLKVWKIAPHVLLRDDFEILPKEAGFRTIDFCCSYALAAYDTETSNRLIVIARK